MRFTINALEQLLSFNPASVLTTCTIHFVSVLNQINQWMRIIIEKYRDEMRKSMTGAAASLHHVDIEIRFGRPTNESSL